MGKHNKRTRKTKTTKKRGGGIRMTFTVNDIYNRLKDLKESGYGEYPLCFDYEGKFLEYDGYYTNNWIIINLTEEEEDY